MKLMARSLKQALAIIISFNLLSATVPPYVLAAADRSPGQPRIQTPASASGLGGNGHFARQSAPLPLRAQFGLEAEGERPSLPAHGTKLVRPAVTIDKPNLPVAHRGREPFAKPQFDGRVGTLGAPGLTFIENKGQWDERARYQLKGDGKTLWLTNSGIVFDSLRAKSEEPGPPNDISVIPDRLHRGPEEYDRLVFYEDFIGAESSLSIEPIDPKPSAYNYLIGSDPEKWHTNVRGYGGVIYRNVWEGVDFTISGNGPNLEQEFVVRPGADLSRVQVAYRGIEKLEIAKDGSLLIHTAYGSLHESKPRIYQQIGGKRETVEGAFKLTGETAYSFEVSQTNPEYALVIDPTVLYSTFLGGSAGYGCFIDCSTFESGNSVAVDSQGNAYVSGFTFSSDFPITPGAYLTTAPLPGSGNQGFVTKLNALGSQLIYSTYFPGVSYSIAVNNAGEAYIVGSAGNGFPTTANGYQQSCSGAPFLTKLNAAGSGLVYSTCFGQSSDANVLFLALDRGGKAYITGRVSSGIPITAGAYQSTGNGQLHPFLSVLDPSVSGSAGLVYSTYLGGSSTDAAEGVAVDTQGIAYITGWTTSANFPVTAGAFQTTYSGGQEGFVAKLNPSASGNASLIYSTYLGPPTPGPNATDIPTGIAVDALGNAYVTGYAYSSAFPVTPGAFQTVHGNKRNAFVTKLNPAGNSLVYSTFLGGNSLGDGDFATSIAVDSFGDAYITGSTTNLDFPTTPGAFQPIFGGRRGGFFFYGDAFVTKFNPSGSALTYSTYLGGLNGDGGTGIAVDAVGDAYVTGFTSSPDFPFTPAAFQPTLNPGGSSGPADAFVTKFALGTTAGLSIVGITPNVGGNAGSVTATITGTGFLGGAIVKLTCPGQPDIVATNVAVAANGRTVSGTFALKGANPGVCDVFISNPDGTNINEVRAFEIQTGGSVDMWIDIVGPSEMRAGGSQNYYLVYGNRGNVDAGQVVVSVELPRVLTLQLLPGQVPLLVRPEGNGNTLVAFTLADVPPQRSGALAIGVAAPPLGTDVALPFELNGSISWLNPE